MLLDEKKFNLLNTDYPIGYINDFLDLNTSQNLREEIENFSSFDDLVMNGRRRVNKGSNKFNEYLKNYPNISNLYNELNSEDIYERFKELLLNDKTKNIWRPILKKVKFSKESYGEQNFNLFKYLKKKKFISQFFPETLNLDMDFSKSEFGYFRKAHRDRETRVISILIYLNTIDENQGGSFEVYKSENGKKDLGRFPDALHVKKTHSFPPKAGQLFIFLSSPNSYHGVSKFLSKETFRTFIYGSYSLDREVEWEII